MTLLAPFPWFGGKSRVAPEVWVALGDVANYVEPFAGSLAVLLQRPHAPHIETVNDIDRYLANFWRALQHAPDEVARHADWPVNETDLLARHIWLVNTGAERVQRLEGDPDYCDAKVAGWWVWGISSWIGSGWCAGNSCWSSVDGKLVNLREVDSGSRGVSRQLPHLGGGGMGVNAARIHGVNRKLPHLGNSGMGVNASRVQGVSRQHPHLGNGRGVYTQRATDLHAYMRALADRLRRVRVCCGDWARVVTRGALSHGKTVGVFLDPPYDTSVRDSTIYNTDAEHGNVSAAVREWCLENGDNPRYRIVLAGYSDEHAMPDNWRVIEWSAGVAYQTAEGASAGGNTENRHKERLWLSPHCLGNGQPHQAELF